MTDIEIKIPATKQGSYPIRIGADFLASLWEQIEGDFSRPNKFIVTDENLVSAGHLQRLVGNIDINTFVITPAGETSKNFNTVVSITEAMEKACFGRDSLVIALGGGTVGDIASFAASIFKRGVPVVHIPTTTVAQADSSIGGKAGVDSSISKNAFGTFWHPSAIYIDVTTLKTLDDRQYRAGLIESVKHAIIADSEYFDFIESNLDSILARKPDILEKMALYNCKIKGGVVEVDPVEKNQRRMLNYGHTVGHAVEAASGFELLHGEAVAIGIVAAGLIELEMGLTQPEKLKRIKEILEKINVPITLPENLDEKTLIELIKHDKKAVGKWPRFVLTSDIGTVCCRDGQYALEITPEVVKKVLSKL